MRNSLLPVLFEYGSLFPLVDCSGGSAPVAAIRLKLAFSCAAFVGRRYIISPEIALRLMEVVLP